MKMVNRKKAGDCAIKIVLMIITLVHISKRKNNSVLNQKFKWIRINLIQIYQSLVYCPQGYDVQNVDALQPIYDDEILLQVFKVCKSATLVAKQCTANTSCQEFNYTLQNCALERYTVAIKKNTWITCKKNKTGNIPLSQYTMFINIFAKRTYTLINKALNLWIRFLPGWLSVWGRWVPRCNNQ